MEFDVVAERLGGVAVVRVTGEVDLMSAPQLRSALTEVIGSGSRRIVVDLAGVVFLDSSGLGALVGALKLLRSHGDGTMVLAAPPPPVQRTIELTGINKVFVVETSVEAAVEHLPD